MKLTIPESISSSYPQQYVLCIITDSDYYSFSLHNCLTGEVFYQALNHDKQPDAFAGFRQAFFENDFFTLPYKKVYIINRAPLFTFVPASIYEEKDKKTWFDFNISGNSDLILAQKIPNPEIVVLHALPDSVYEFFIRSFSNPQFVHHQSLLIAHFQERNLHDNKCRMIVNVHKKGMDIVCYSHTSFILGNYLFCRSLDDMVYFILFSWKQLKFDQLNDTLHIVGSEKSKDLAEVLKDYLKNIVLTEMPTDVPYELSLVQSCEL